MKVRLALVFNILKSFVKLCSFLLKRKQRRSLTRTFPGEKKIEFCD